MLNTAINAGLDGPNPLPREKAAQSLAERLEDANQVELRTGDGRALRLQDRGDRKRLRREMLGCFTSEIGHPGPCCALRHRANRVECGFGR
jgi:hypothetical protein